MVVTIVITKKLKSANMFILLIVLNISFGPNKSIQRSPTIVESSSIASPNAEENVSDDSKYVSWGVDYIKFKFEGVYIHTQYIL